MLSLNSAISVLQCLWFTSLWPTMRHVGCPPVILWKMLLYFVTLPPVRMRWIFLWPFCLWAKRRPSTVSIGPSFCVPFCLWALVPLLLAGLNFWVKLLRELNTALLNFFWGGKKDLVAFDVVIHHREDSGFQLVSFPSVAKCMPSLPSGSSVCVFLLVSLLTFWCYNRFGVDPVFVLHTFIPCIPGFCRLSMLPCFLREGCCQGRCWCILVKFQGGGVGVGGLFLFPWAQCLCPGGGQLVAQAQGYQLVCIWGSLVKFQGVCFTALGLRSFLVQFSCQQ